MTVLLGALLIGLAAGSRTFLAPAATSLAVTAGWIDLSASALAVLGTTPAAIILIILAVGELIADTLPFVPSRKAAGPFIARIVSGALSGAALGSASAMLGAGAFAGIVGAVIGTLGGFALRRRMAEGFGRDLPAALCEDALAIALATLAVIAAS